MNVPQFINPSTAGRPLVSFHFGVNMDRAAVNIVLHYTSFGESAYRTEDCQMLKMLRLGLACARTIPISD